MEFLMSSIRVPIVRLQGSTHEPLAPTSYLTKWAFMYCSSFHYSDISSEDSFEYFVTLEKWAYLILLLLYTVGLKLSGFIAIAVGMPDFESLFKRLFCDL